MKKETLAILLTILTSVIVSSLISAWTYQNLGNEIIKALSSRSNSRETMNRENPSRDIVLHAPSPDEKALQKYKRSGFNEIVMKHSKEFSDCYKNYLGEDSDGKVVQQRPENFIREGILTYVFDVAENGKMLSFKLIRDDFQETSFEKCISNHFNDLHFLPPPLGINRFISHDFSFKTEETYKRELEERKNQALPKVLPVGPEE